MFGRTRFVVCRLFIHPRAEVAPLIGLLNRSAREAIDSDGDLETIGSGLVEICQNLSANDAYKLN